LAHKHQEVKRRRDGTYIEIHPLTTAYGGVKKIRCKTDWEWRWKGLCQSSGVLPRGADQSTPEWKSALPELFDRARFRCHPFRQKGGRRPSLL